MQTYVFVMKSGLYNTIPALLDHSITTGQTACIRPVCIHQQTTRGHGGNQKMLRDASPDKYLAKVR
jgi:hypothetical protein